MNTILTSLLATVALTGTVAAMTFVPRPAIEQLATVPSIACDAENGWQMESLGQLPSELTSPYHSLYAVMPAVTKEATRIINGESHFEVGAKDGLRTAFNTALQAPNAFATAMYYASYSYQARHDPYMCPLTFDLLGDGISVTPDRSVDFDLAGNGKAAHIAWLNSIDDVQLVLNNNDGTFNGNDLFGGANGGFAKLAGEDTNHDGKINNADATYAKMELWFDINHDAVLDEGELTPLKNLIEEIDLPQQATAQQPLNSLAYIGATSTAKAVGGGEITVMDVYYDISVPANGS